MSGSDASPGDPGSTQADRRLLRRASAVVAVQTGLAAALVVAAVIALVYSISQQERHDAVAHKTEEKANELLAKMRLPEEQWATGTEVTHVDDLPADAECPAPPGDGWADDLPPGSHEVTLCEMPFLAHVAESDGLQAVAAMSLVEQQEETERLARLSIIVGGMGVLAAAGLGWLTGRRAVEPLGQALAAQRRFVADASHELRTPLAILHTRAQLLQRQPHVNEDQHRELDQLVEDARVLTDIVNDMLLSAEMRHRPGAGQPVDMDRVVADIKNSYSGTADETGVDLVVDIDPTDRHIVTGAPSALRRAVASLVDNALGHVDHGGTVTIQLNGSISTVRVSVIDDGEGFAPELAAELPQRFRRGPNAAPSGDRFGLGLSLVEEVVHAHNGTMDINGRPGVGATVTLIFPSAQ